MENSHSGSSQDGDNKAHEAPSQSPETTPPGDKTAKKPSKIKTMWNKLGLDMATCSMMFKGSVAPTIAIAMYQSPAVAAQYTTLGYLTAIMSILGFPIMPRGKFIQTMSLNVLGVCLGAAVIFWLYTRQYRPV